MLSGEWVIRWFECLGGLSLFLQCLEYARLTPCTDPGGVWSWPVQRADIPDEPGWLKRLLDWLYQPRVYKAQLAVRALASLALMVLGNHVVIATVLFIGTLLLLVRWRGAFNGGSDFMTLITVTGLMIAAWVGAFTDEALGWSAGLGYVALQTLSSYFVSGWVKLKRPEWRSGEALTVFLNSGLYGPLSSNSWFRRPRVALVCSWAFILWEGLFVAVLWHPAWTPAFVGVALLFHGLVFWFFGLNRFFWAWAANLGSVFFLGHYLS